MGIATVALLDQPCSKLSMTSGSDQAIGSARQTSPRIPPLCERAATKPKTRHTGPTATSQGRASRHAAKSPTDSRSANNPWYEMSHARRYAPIVPAPSTPAFRSERLLRVAQTASTKPIVSHGAMPAPTTIRGPTICLTNCAVTPERRPTRKAPVRMLTIRDANGTCCRSILIIPCLSVDPHHSLFGGHLPVRPDVWLTISRDVVIIGRFPGQSAGDKSSTVVSHIRSNSVPLGAQTRGARPPSGCVSSGTNVTP
jgi:hypothetical protein